MRNIAIVTARSGSKGIKDKNIKAMAGRPMMAYSIEAAIKSKLFEKVMVSTDSTEYAKIALQCGAEVPFLRSAETSGDSAGSWEAVREVLDGYRNIGHMFDTFCLLQPTSPLRTSADIVSAYNLLSIKDADAVTSVCECEYPMEFMMTLDGSMSLKEFRRNEIDLPRQMLPTYYRLNGAIFVRRIQYKSDKIVIKSDEEYAYVMGTEKSIDIDTLEDFEYAEYLLLHGKGED